jgi:alpha-N-acetylglucosaminidase
MLAIWWLLTVAFPLISAHTTSLDGVKALLQRRVPNHANSFSFELVNGANDSFVLSDSKTAGIDIKCTSVSACSRGLYTQVPANLRLFHFQG